MRSIAILAVILVWTGCTTGESAGPSTAPSDNLRVLATASPPKDPSTKLAVIMQRLPEPTTQEVMEETAREGRPVVVSLPGHSFGWPMGDVVLLLLRMRGNEKPQQPEGADILQVVYAIADAPGLEPSTLSASLAWTDDGAGYMVLSRYASNVTFAAYAIPADGKPIGQYPLDLRNRPKPSAPLAEFMADVIGPIVGVTVKTEGRKLIAQVARIHSLTGVAVKPTVLKFDPSSGKWRLVE